MSSLNEHETTDEHRLKKMPEATCVNLCLSVVDKVRED